MGRNDQSESSLGIKQRIEIERKSEQSEQPNEHLISIDVVQLKQVLFNRLQTYHEKHIDELISTYKLDSKKSIDKITMEKL